MKRDTKGRLEEEAIDLKRKRKIGLSAEVKEMESFHWVVRLDLGLPQRYIRKPWHCVKV